MRGEIRPARLPASQAKKLSERIRALPFSGPPTERSEGV